MSHNVELMLSHFYMGLTIYIYNKNQYCQISLLQLEKLVKVFLLLYSSAEWLGGHESLKATVCIYFKNKNASIAIALKFSRKLTLKRYDFSVSFSRGSKLMQQWDYINFPRLNVKCNNQRGFFCAWRGSTHTPGTLSISFSSYPIYLSCRPHGISI